MKADTNMAEVFNSRDLNCLESSDWVSIQKSNGGEMLVYAPHQSLQNDFTEKITCECLLQHDIFLADGEGRSHRGCLQ